MASSPMEEGIIMRLVVRLSLQRDFRCCFTSCTSSTSEQLTHLTTPCFLICNKKECICKDSDGSYVVI